MSQIIMAHQLNNFGGTSPYTQAVPIRFDVNTRVTRLGFFSNASYGPVTGVTVRPKIWNASAVMVAEGTNTVLNLNAQTAEFASYNTPYTCLANTVYYIGGYQSGYTNYYSNSQHTHGPVDGVTLTSVISGYNSQYASGDTNNFTSSQPGYEFQYIIEFNNNDLPTAPTGVSVAGSIATNSNPVASWTHNDPNGDAQAGYQTRWRKV